MSEPFSIPIHPLCYYRMAVDQSKNLLRLIFLYIIKYLKEQTEFLNRNAILFIGARKLKAQVV